MINLLDSQNTIDDAVRESDIQKKLFDQGYDKEQIALSFHFKPNNADEAMNIINQIKSESCSDQASIFRSNPSMVKDSDDGRPNTLIPPNINNNQDIKKISPRPMNQKLGA